MRRCSRKIERLVCLPKCFILWMFLLFIFFIEWLSLPLVSTIFWTFHSLNRQNSKSVVILLIADPQLIGYRNEQKWVGWLSRWDADRFMRRCYSEVSRQLEPSLEIFLGDLFDEGTTMNNQQFEWTLQRFYEIFPNDTRHADRIYVPGDNDIGGEMEPIYPHLLERFRRSFPSEISNHLLSTRLLSISQIDPLGRFGIERVFSGSAEVTIRILLSHRPVTRFLSSETHQLLSQHGINIILSAHDHVVSIFERDHSSSIRFHRITAEQISRSLQLTPNPKLDTNFTKSFSNQPLLLPDLEFQSPTVSYRMGVPRIGYGVLVLTTSNDSNISADFQVIWVPGRYPQLFAYLIFLVLALTYSISCHCLKRIRKWKRSMHKKLSQI